MRLYPWIALPDSLCLVLIVSAFTHAATPSAPTPLVGIASASLSSAVWQPLPSPNAPDVAWGRRGLQLSLGAGSTDVPPSTPFYWASVTRVVDVDASKYPILAVRAVNLAGPSWWDVEVQGVAGYGGINGGTSCPLPYGRSPLPTQTGGLIGTEVKTPSLDHDGLILFDLQAQQKNGLFLGGHRLRLRLSVAGTSAGGSVDYDGLRFLSREDAARLR